MLSAVKEFGRGLLKPYGVPAGTLECYIEVPFTLGEQRLYPDGLIRVSRGARTWTALVEVKTGPNLLQSEQLEKRSPSSRVLLGGGEVFLGPAGDLFERG